MAILATVFSFIGQYPIILLIGFALYCLVFYISLMFTKPKAGRNPFIGDTRRPPNPIIHDKALRDKVIKQGFAQKKIPSDIDVIVIGSGISGLTTAALLAKAGKKCVVLEQHDQAGGCCHTFVEKGFEFDSGIHYIGEMQHRTLQRTLFEQISDGQVQWQPLEQNFDTVAVGPSGKAKMYPLLSGKTEFRQSLVDNFPNDTEAIDKFLNMLKKARGCFLYFVMLKVLPVKLCNWIVSLRLLEVFTNYGTYANMTTTEYLDSISDNDQLKAVLGYCFGDYGTTPDSSSVVMHSLLINHFAYASSYPIGGASEIAMNIIPVIERSGGRVFVRANVTDIIIEKGRAVGVRVSKGDAPIEIRAKTVVSAGGIPNTLKLLPTDVAKKTTVFDLMQDRSIESGVGAFSLFVGLKGTTEELGLKAQNLWAFTDADLNGKFHSFCSHEPDVDNPVDIPLLFISFPSTKDPTWEERYPGKSVCTVVTLGNYNWFQQWQDDKVMHRGDDYEALKTSFSKQMWSQVCKFYPQLEDKVEYMELGSPVTNNYYIRSTKGEIYGLDHNKNRFRPDLATKLRPEIGVPGLYLTGQDVLVCGFSGGMFSGMVTASAMLHRNLMQDCIKLNGVIKKKEKQQEKGDKKTN